MSKKQTKSSVSINYSFCNKQAMANAELIIILASYYQVFMPENKHKLFNLINMNYKSILHAYFWLSDY